MKCMALVCVVSLLAGCSGLPREYRPMKNGDFYVGGGGSVVERSSIGNSIRSVREAQIAGSGRALVDTDDGTVIQANSLQLLVGYQVSKALDLEATLFTNGQPLDFSSWHRVDDPSGRSRVRNEGELQESGVMLTALANWRLHQYFQVFARLGGSYNQTTLKSSLEKELGDDRFINQVKYRAEGIQPVWGVGITISEVARFEYQARKVPIGSTASDLRTSSGGSFEAAKIGGNETLHSFMITVRFGLKNLFGGEE